MRLPPRQTENEGAEHSRTGARTACSAGLILRWAAKPARLRVEPGCDEHPWRDILTTGLILTPAFPSLSAQWLSSDLGVCVPIQWRYRPRFSRGSRTSTDVLKRCRQLRPAASKNAPEKLCGRALGKFFSPFDSKSVAHPPRRIFHGPNPVGLHDARSTAPP